MRYGDSPLPETNQTPGWLLFCKQNDSLEKAVSRQCFSEWGCFQEICGAQESYISAGLGLWYFLMINSRLSVSSTFFIVSTIYEYS